MWIGIDDTDSSSGGCTTYTVWKVLQALKDSCDIIGHPRLVRLNPNVPWKTRGNGALAFEIGHGSGRTIRIGTDTNGNAITSYETLSYDLTPDESTAIWMIIENTVNESAWIEDEKTNPGLVMLRFQAPYNWYRRSVTQIVNIDEVKTWLKEHAIHYQGIKKGRGLIGATAATAWIPSDTTFECIYYRKEENWGTKRHVDDNSVIALDELFPSTFDNYDHLNHHNQIVPSSPCPVLFGIRGDDFHDVIAASKTIEADEPIAGHLTFESNQGSDDHLVNRKIAQAAPYESVVILGRVCKEPTTVEGGHVIFTIKDDTGTMDCAAYEPTKEFRDTVRQLILGDIVKVAGGIRTEPACINLEKIHVMYLESKISLENPLCQQCGKHMKSKGVGQGFKCPRCNTSATEKTKREHERGISPRWYEVPVCARRHLSRPLSRKIKIG